MPSFLLKTDQVHYTRSEISELSWEVSPENYSLSAICRYLPLVAVSSVSCSERLAPWMIGFTKGHSFTIVMRWANLFSTLEILDFYSSVTKSALILIMSMAAPFEIFSCELSVMPMKVNSFCQISRVYLSVTKVYTIYQHSAQEVRSRRRRYPEVPKRNFSMCVAHKGDANGD